jgi:cysteine-rich repeat protein
MARRLLWLLGGAMAAACALPDVSIVSSFGGEAGAGRGGAGAGGKGGTGGAGGSSGKGAGGSSGRGDAGEGGDGMAVGGGGGATGGTGGDAGRPGAGSGGAGTSSGGSSGGVAPGGTRGGGTTAGGTSGGGTTAGGASGAAGGGIAGSGGKSSSVCGDGTQDADEACDDGNSLECGTCSADCLTAISFAPARGTIRVEAGAPADGERFTLDDGFLGVAFEFDNDGMWDMSLMRLELPTMLSANALRDRIIAAVNDPTIELAITAEAGANEGEVVLTNDRPGSRGNRPITDQVNGSGFTHTGMSGGVGDSCPGGAPCFVGTDCVSTICEAGFCVP